MVDQQVPKPKRAVPSNYPASIPLAFVIVALLGLVLIPMLAQRRVRQLDTFLQANAEPARAYVTQIHVSLASGAAALRDFLDTRDNTFLERYRWEAKREDYALTQLRPLAENLGSAGRTRLEDLYSWSRRWHARAEGLIRGSTTWRETAAGLSEEDAYESTLLAAARLDETINAAVTERRTRLSAATRVQIATSVGLGLFALAAAIGIGGIVRRIRVYAREAETRRSEAVAALASKERLIRGITHDLKNPLNAISGNAQLLEQGVYGELNASQIASVERIRDSVTAQLRYVEDLLELSRVGNESLRLDLRATDLNAMVGDVVSQYAPAANAASTILRFEPGSNLPQVPTDPDRARQVLGNLLGNAIKYTGSDGVVVIGTHLRSRRGAKAPFIAIDVADNGPGIVGENQAAVFEEFTRFDTTGVTGSGIGLAIARRIARLLGGDLTLESQPGKGSTFTFWLPVDVVTNA